MRNYRTVPFQFTSAYYKAPHCCPTYWAILQISGWKNRTRTCDLQEVRIAVCAFFIFNFLTLHIYYNIFFLKNQKRETRRILE